MSEGTPRGRRRLFLVLAVAVVATVFFGSGCGGKGEDQEEARPAQKALVPGGTPDSTGLAPADTALTESVYEAGTLRASGGVTDRPQDELKAPATETETPPATKKLARPATATSKTGSYSLQLGSFTNPDNARKQADRIRTLGYDPAVVQYDLGGQTYHRVMLRRVGDMAAASKLGEHIHSQLGIAYLVRLAN